MPDDDTWTHEYTERVGWYWRHLDALLSFPAANWYIGMCVGSPLPT